MAIVVNRHSEALTLPIAGTRLVPGSPSKVERWNVVKRHDLVKAWLSVKVIEVMDEPEVVEPESAPVAVPDDLDELRAQYQEAFGKKAYHGWDAEALKAKLADEA